MNGTLITFDNLEEHEEDMLGGHIEIDDSNNIRRGRIVSMSWWDHHPAQIFWANCIEWNPYEKRWQRQEDIPKQFFFRRDRADYFCGPAELTSGEIIFTYEDFIGITIFPHGHNPPGSPGTRERVESLNKLFHDFFHHRVG